MKTGSDTRLSRHATLCITDAQRNPNVSYPDRGTIGQLTPASSLHGSSTPLVIRCSPQMLELGRIVDRLAPRKITVLVQGETGTGKDVIARELHDKSDRSQGPLQVVNCGAIPQHLTTSVLFGHARGAFTGADRDHDGVFVRAHGGTVFLDEVGELSAEAQAALLRVLDTQHVCPVGGRRETTVDVRVIAATHRNLAEMAAQGTFRCDLFHRLNSVVLRVPPLRERKEEIVPLSEGFLARFQSGTSVVRLSEEVCARLVAYEWPGNVRELRNVIERAVALCEGAFICEDDLPPQLLESSLLSRQSPTGSDAEPAAPPIVAIESGAGGTLSLRALLRRQEICLIEAALRRTNGNQRQAASLLQLPLRTLERKLHVLAIRRND